MGWEDPSPRAQACSPGGNPAAQPGYGDPGVRLSFMVIAMRWAVALLVGGLVYAGAHKGFGAWFGPAHATAVLAISLALAAAVAWLLLRVLMRLPQSEGAGVSLGRRRGWDDTSGLTFGEVVAADAVGDVVGAIIDAATD
jgi:hypothetical protein